MVVAPARIRRPYHSPKRQERARATRRRVLEAAGGLFTERGYSGTTIRAVAERAGLSVPTVEELFGSKGRLLKATIDVAIAGDDESVPMLDRGWAAAATQATDVGKFLSILAGVLTLAQARSSGLVLSVFEGAGVDAELAGLAAQMSSQRATMATWVVARVTALGALRDDLDQGEAVDTVFALMEPALFERLVRQRSWGLARYEAWVAKALGRLLVADALLPAAVP